MCTEFGVVSFSRNGSSVPPNALILMQKEIKTTSSPTKILRALSISCDVICHMPRSGLESLLLRRSASEVPLVARCRDAELAGGATVKVAVT